MGGSTGGPRRSPDQGSLERASQVETAVPVAPPALGSAPPRRPRAWLDTVSHPDLTNPKVRASLGYKWESPRRSLDLKDLRSCLSLV